MTFVLGGVVGRRTKVYVRISNTLPFKLHNTTENFVAAKTKNFKQSWHKLTTDPWIRNTITGYQVEMNDQPVQICEPKPLKFSCKEKVLINLEIDRFLKCKFIEPVSEIEPYKFASNIFFRPKKDGKIRIILNLKTLNSEYLEKQHFKIESLQSAVNAMRKTCWFRSVDLAEAFWH